MIQLDTLIIIGNGYDIAYELPTRYEDFIKSVLFQQHAKKDGLFSYISDKYENKNWSDLEMMLSSYERELSAKHSHDAMINVDYDYWDNSNEKIEYDKDIEAFEEDVYELKDLLLEYLTNVTPQPKVRKNEKTHSSIRGNVPTPLEDFAPLFPFEELQKSWSKECSPKSRIISFNYTEPIGLSALFPHDAIRHIHGRLSDGQIVLGVDDSQYVNAECSFIKKIEQGGLALNDLDDYFNVNRYIVWGCSMGESDKWFFEKLFKSSKYKVFEIFAHSQIAISRIKRNMSSICGNLRTFEENNLVKTFCFNPKTEENIIKGRDSLFNEECNYIDSHQNIANLIKI